MRHSSLSTLYLRWARHLVELYPASWRERYAEEMLLILEDYPPTFKTIINLFFHLFDAYTHQHLVKRRLTPMLQRIRSSELTIYGAAVIFFLAYLLAEICATATIGPSYPSIPFQYAFYILLLLILIGGLPMLLTTGWKALKTRNRRVLLFLLLGFMCPLITIYLIVSFATVIGLLWFVSSCIISLGMSLTLIYFAVQGVTPSRHITHSVLYLATPLPLIMLVSLTSFLFDVLHAFRFHILHVFTASGFIPPIMYDGYIFYGMYLMLLIMGATFFFSLISLLKGFQAKWATQDTL